MNTIEDFLNPTKDELYLINLKTQRNDKRMDRQETFNNELEEYVELFKNGLNGVIYKTYFLY